MTWSRFFSYEAFGVSSPFDPTFHYVSSPILPPSVLGALRLLFAVYTLVTDIVTLTDDPTSYLSYFTNLTYTGLTAYFWAAGVQTIAFVLRRRKSYPLQTWPRFLQLLHVVLYSTVTVFPIIVTAVYWALIANSTTFATRFSSWSNISKHAMNTFFALFEIVAHGGPSPWMHLVPLIVILGFYVAVAYITRATEGFYVYSFLNPTQEGGLLAAYIIGIALGCCVVFCVVKGLCHLRHRISVRYGRFEDGSEAGALDEWEEVAAPGKESSTDV
ncbi:hypothetical protein L210DRAFT_3452269 [Boletus edulis BED1]|uniref:FAR-17a/AIG1-like protein n=1 Tax=Boletus edulis BED1 TaxID=1328754 RepID=A0AAD4BQ01_BOLED|nr:hypothetical protein L210DRAFT_3452269 [Boletus edulis BED1]